MTKKAQKAVIRKATEEEQQDRAEPAYVIKSLRNRAFIKIGANNRYVGDLLTERELERLVKDNSNMLAMDVQVIEK